VLFAVSRREDVQIEPAGQRLEDVAHLAEHELILLHVRAAEGFGQPRARGLLPGEIVWCLRSIAERQLGVRVEIAGGLHHRDQIGNRNPAQRVARALGPCACRAESCRHWHARLWQSVRR
jgi:hypothetical protein